MPAKSKAQFRAMAAAAQGDSDVIDIPPKKAKEYLKKVRYSKLPETVSQKSKSK
jgi:hypothetical protein